jgi:hypothetical protein
MDVHHHILEVLMRKYLTLSALLQLFIFSSSFFPSLQPTASGNGDDFMIYLPLVTNKNGSANPLIVNHLNTDVHEIPDYWINEARKLVIHYAHTSHGSQILTGLQWLEAQDPKYNVSIIASGVVAQPPDSTAMGFYDGNNYSGTTYITPDMYWESAAGIQKTQSVVATGWFDISLWTWCGQMSDYSVTQVETYMAVLDQLERDYPALRTVYYTGHTDGSTQASTLWRNNNLVRAYAQDNGKALFDFADIESYDPAGTFYPTANDACPWCATWCSDHPTSFECQNLGQMGDCAHSHKLQCALKAQAFWQLMARMAGWDG